MTTAQPNRITLALKLSGRAFGPYKWQILLLTALGFVSGFLEGIGINLLIPLFSFALKKETQSDDYITQTIERFFGRFSLDVSIGSLLTFIVVLFMLKALITIGLEYIKIRITADFEQDTRKRLFQKVLRADWPHLLKHKLGYLETILMIDITASANLFRQISTGISFLSGLIIYLLIALNISLPITLITFALGMIFLFMVKPLIYKTKIAAYQRIAATKEISHYVSENILGVKTVKTMSAGANVLKKGAEFFEKLRVLWIRSSMLETVSTSFVQPLSVIYFSLLFLFIYQSPAFEFGMVVALMYIIYRIFTYVQHLQRTWHKFNNLFPHLKKTLDFEEEAQNSQEKNSGTKKFVFSQSLEFKNVHFSYDPIRPVLQDVNFSVKKGELVGLIGPSGGGKTTLVDLLLRLFEPTQGRILIEGENISEIMLDEWRKKIGYVSQDIFLMNDTIENNIRFYDDTITKKDLVKVAKMANIDEFIQSRPEGFQTVIGDRGLTLSAGQRQRIVIARILARSPEILILDEATSALDAASEHEIQSVINELKGKMTILAIAHRLTTVEHCDRLMVLLEGTIVEQGKPQDLLKNKDSYFFKTSNIH